MIYYTRRFLDFGKVFYINYKVISKRVSRLYVYEALHILFQMCEL